MARRRKALERQLDGVLQSLSNSIQVTQNLEEAFVTLAQQWPPPISQEADLIVKQLRLGASVDDALRDMATRTASRYVDALAMVLSIGRRTGGELPKILGKTAQVLRETLRVEGLMEAKTAEGKAQIFMLALLPFAFGAMINRFNPDWMRPIFHDWVGWIIIGVASALEGVGLLLAVKLTRLEV